MMLDIELTEMEALKLFNFFWIIDIKRHHEKYKYDVQYVCTCTNLFRESSFNVIAPIP